MSLDWSLNMESTSVGNAYGIPATNLLSSLLCTLIAVESGSLLLHQTCFSSLSCFFFSIVDHYYCPHQIMQNFQLLSSNHGSHLVARCYFYCHLVVGYTSSLSPLLECIPETFVDSRCHYYHSTYIGYLQLFKLQEQYPTEPG